MIAFVSAVVAGTVVAVVWRVTHRPPTFRDDSEPWVKPTWRGGTRDDEV